MSSNYTSISTKNDSTAFLQGPGDWDKWNKQFQAKAVAYSLWEHIDPEAPETEAFLTKPPEPSLNDYATETIITESQTQRRQQGRRATSATNDHITVADLSTDGQKSFQLAWTIYIQHKREYAEQKTKIQDLKDWVISSVASYLFESACDPSESIRDWYTKIKQHSGASDDMTTTQARDSYKKAIVVLTKPPRDFHIWLNNWEQAMSRGQAKGVPEALSVPAWFDDFLNAVEPLMGNWTSSYRLYKQDKVDSRSLTYRILANDFRKELRHRKSTPSSAKYAKGSFGPAFGPMEKAIDSAEGNSPPSQGAESSQKSTGRRIAGSRSIRGQKRAASENQEAVLENQGTKLCPVCNLNHKLSKCYYALPELAPDDFQPREHIQERAKSSLQKKDVINQLQTIKNKRQKLDTNEQPKD
jgi:hypothetical protein